MEPIIEWTTHIPTSPSEECIKESVLAAINLPGVRDVQPLVHTISIGCTFMEHGVQGVGYDAEGKPIVALKYSWVAKTGKACHFDDPRKVELLNF